MLEQNFDRTIYLKIKARKWCFVWNNYTEADVEQLMKIAADKIDYLIFGFEIGENGTKHLQGYAEFNNMYTGSSVKTRLDPIAGKKSKVSVEPARDHFAAIQYCKKLETKDPDRDPKFIEIIHRVKKQGERNDWHAIRDMITEGKSLNEISLEFPEQTMKCASGIEKIILAQKEATAKAAAYDHYVNATLRPWQANLIPFIKNGTQGDREITWFVDTEGGAGKSWLKKYLVSTMNAIAFGNNRTCDVAHAWNGEPLVIFDFTRETEERINYAVIEDIKNGYIFSPKYNSVAKNYKSPTVICFSNFEPKRSAFSKDRWDLRYVNNNYEVDPRLEPTDVEGILDFQANQETHNTALLTEFVEIQGAPEIIGNDLTVAKDNLTSTKVDYPSRNTIPAGWRRAKGVKKQSKDFVAEKDQEDNIGPPKDLLGHI